jgi:type IV secretory pathway TraG/TraD family ATPase VirD4
MFNIASNGWRPLTTKILILSGIIWLTMMSLPTMAQVFFITSKWTCGSTTNVVETLNKANEKVFAIGTLSVDEAESVIMSLWVSKNGTWSVIATSKSNLEISCIVLAGEGFLRYNANEMRI